MADESFPIEVEQRGNVVIWTIDREPRMNSLSRATLLAFGKLAREAVSNPSVRAIVITGRGDKAFCAGADLKERQGMTENDIRVQVELYRSELGAARSLARSRSIAALNGVAFGGGLELALVCDLRVAAAHVEGRRCRRRRSASSPAPAARSGSARIVGEARAKEMILLGRRLDAAEALAWGLVNRVTPAGTNVVDDALAFIEPIANGAPIAQAAALEAIDRSFDVALELGLELEKVSYDKVLVSEDRREALAAFAEKRKPVFKGR